MRALLQRVSRASVTVDGKVVGRVEAGWLVMLGVAKGDAEGDALRLAEKTAHLRGFADEVGKMNVGALEIGAGVLVVSQFTLVADCNAGRRPSFTAAADPAEAERLYLCYVVHLRAFGLHVETGVFRAHMDVELVNDGPVTFWLETKGDL